MMRRVAIWMLAALLLVTGLPGLAGPRAAAAEPRALAMETAVDFPESLRFTLTGEATEPVQRVELLYTIAENKTRHLRTVSGPIEPGPIALDETIDMRVAFIPPGVDLTYVWRVTFASGSVFETEPAAVTWLDTRFAWESVGTDQVTIYYYTGNEAFARVVLDSAQSTIDRLQREFGVERSGKIRLWVYNTRTDYAGTQAPNSLEWSVGVAFPAYQVILAVLPEGNQREVGRVVPHEISHQVLHQATRNPFNSPPTWFDEGLAVVAQDSGAEDFQNMVRRASENDRLFSVRALTSEFPFDPADASLAYAQSYSILRFMISKWGAEGVGRVIAGYRDGKSHDDVLLTSLGVDMAGLDRLWKESLDDGGDAGAVAGTGSDARGSSWEHLLVSASEALLVLAAFVSIAFMWRRRRRNRDEEPAFEPDARPL